TNTLMPTPSKPEMAVQVRPRRIETVWVWEFVWIPIRRRVHQSDWFFWQQELFSDLGRTSHCAGKAPIGCVHSQKLFQRRLQGSLPRPQRCMEFWIQRQMAGDAADQQRRCHHADHERLSKCSDNM